MANVVNDPRFQMARLMRQQAQQSLPQSGFAGGALPKAPSQEAVSLGRAAASFSLSNPTLRQQIDAISKGGKAAEPQGVAGFLVGNPVTKTALGALDILSIPGRATAATIREIIDSRDNDPNTKASFSDFLKNTKDPTYGIGKALKIDTGNIWLDRGLGFVGDIFTDPLNLVTFGGAKFAGYAGRLDLAKEVLKVTNNAELANRVQRFGRAAIKDPEILELAGANRHGLYVFGKRWKVGKNGQGLRLPGTGALGMLGDNALSKIRVSASKTKAGKWIQKMTLPMDNLAARQALLNGTTSDDASAALISFFTADPIQRKAAGEALALEKQRALALLEAEQVKGLDGYKAKLPDLIESDDLFNAATPELQRAAQVWRDLFGQYENNIVEILKEIDPTIDPTTRFRANYFPRMVSEDGMNYMADASATHSSGLRSIFSRDPLSGGRNFKSRTLEVGDEFFGHKLTAEDLKSTSKLNKIAKEAGFGGDFFETDISKVLNRYVEEYAKEIGVLSRHKHLVDTGFWKRAEDVSVTGEFVDQELVDSIKKTIKSLDDDMVDLARQSGEHFTALTTNIAEFKKTLQASLEAAQKELNEAEFLGDLNRAADAVLAGDLRLTADQIELVANNLGQWKQRFADMFGMQYKNGKLVAKAGSTIDDSPIAADGLLGYLDTLESDMLRLSDEIAAMGNGKTIKELDDAVKLAEEKLQSVTRRMDDASERLRIVVQFGNAINEGLEMASRGETFFGGSQEVQDVLALLARDGSLTTDTVERVLKEQFNIAGELQDFLTKWVNSPNSVFDELTLNSGIDKTAVSKFTPSKLYDVLNRSYDTSIDLTEVRVAALFSLARDERIYGAMMPETIQKMRFKLVERLRKIDEAIAYHNEISGKVAQGTRRTGTKIWETQVAVDYDRVIAYREELQELQQFLDEFRNKFDEILRSSPESANIKLEADRLYEIVGNKYPRVQYLIGDIEEDFASMMQDIGTSINTRVKNVEYMADMPDKKYVWQSEDDGQIVYKQSEMGSGFSDVDTLENAGGVEAIAPWRNNGEALTFNELLDLVQGRISRINSYMDEPVFKYGIGVSEKAYTGRELVERFDQYNLLKEELARVAKVRREFEEDIKVSMGFYDIDLEEVGISSEELARRKSRLEYIKSRAQTAAFQREYDDNFIVQLQRSGYFKISRDDVDFISKREKAYNQAANAFAEVKASRPNDANGRRGITRFGDRETEIKNKIKDIAGGDQNLRPQWFSGLQSEKDNLIGDLIDYSVVSEVHARFNGVASIAGGFGFAPTQRMFGQVLDTVGQKFMPRITTKISALYQAQTILRDMDIEVARRLREGTEGLTAGQVFSDVLGSLSTKQRAILVESIGSEMNWTTDPYDLLVGLKDARAGKSKVSSGFHVNADGSVKVDKNGKPLKMPSEKTLAENEYVEKSIRPWWESAYPDTKWPGKDKAIKKLRELRPSRAKSAVSTVSAFSENADATAVRSWFHSMLGRSEIKARLIEQTVGGQPLLDKQIRQLREAEKRFRRMLLPDLDIAKFFDDPSLAQKTPTWYAYMLKDQADRLELAMNAKRGKNLEIVGARTAVGAKQAEALAKGAEYERVRTAPAVLAELNTRRQTLVARQTELSNPNRVLRPIEKRELDNIPAQIKEIDDEITRVSRLPKNTQENIAGAERRNARINEAMKPRLELETELDELVTEGRGLTNKARTKKGLTKREQARQRAVKKRVDEIREELKAPLVDEQGNVLRRTPRDEEVLAMPKKERNILGANKAIDTYNEFIASPAYAKAMDDKEIVDAIIALAEFDLYKMTDGFMVKRAEKGILPDGTYGVISEAQWAVMPNGQRITFTEAEWNSLYRRPHSEQELRLMRSELRELEMSVLEENNRLAARIAEGELNIRRFKRLDRYSRNRQPRYVEWWTREIEKSKATLSANAEILANLKMRQESLLKSTQASALMKMKILVQGSPATRGRTASAPAFNAEGISKFKSFEHPAQSIYSKAAGEEVIFEGTTSAQVLAGAKAKGPDVNKRFAMSSQTGMTRAGIIVDNGIATQRAERLRNIWMTTPEYKTLDKADKLRNNLFVRMDFAMREDLESTENMIGVLRAQVDKVIRDANDLTPDVEVARLRAQETSMTADFLTEQRTGLPVGERLDASYVDEQGNKIYREQSERVDPGLSREVDENGDPFVSADNLRSPDDFRSFSDMVIDNNKPTGPFVVRSDEAQTNVNIDRVARQYDERIAREVEKLNKLLGGETVEEGVDNRVSKIQELIDKSEVELSSLRSSGGSREKIVIVEARIRDANRALKNAKREASKRPTRAIKTVENRIKKLREEKEIALLRARGTDAAVEEYNSAMSRPIARVKNEDGTTTLVPIDELREYNAAKQTRQQWEAENKVALENANKAWDAKAKMFENADIVAKEIERIRSVGAAEINRRFGGVDEYMDYIFNQRNLVESLTNQLKDIENLTKMPPKSALDILVKAGTGGKKLKPNQVKAAQKKVSETVELYREWIKQNKPILDKLASEPNNPVYKAWAAASQADADLIWLDFTKRQQLEQLVLAETPVWAERVIKPFAEGYEKALKSSEAFKGMALAGKRGENNTSTGFPGLMGNKEAMDLLDNISRIREPGVIDDLSRFMRGYTGFFRAYATLSPGFHVRNSMSNVFAIFAAGASTANMREGFKYWRLFNAAIESGKTVDEFVATIPEAYRASVRIAADVVLGLGGGRVDDALAGFARDGSRLTANALIDTSRKAGHTLEASARFMLAYDSAVKGFDFNQSFNRTGRFLVDYNKRTLLDESMRDLVPFWVWMSRNLPLQIMNRWANPRPYLTWMKFQKNFTQQDEENDATPSYLRAMGAINLGGGTFLNPDLPFTRVNQQVEELADPRKLMSYINPGIRAPLEFLMNSNTYTGRPFSDKYHKVDGVLSPFLPLLQATGQVQTDGQGNPVISDRAYSLLMNMLPPVGRAERLFPAEGSGNAGNSLRGFLGLPVTQVTPEMQDKERIRRLMMMQDLVNKNKAIGEAQ